MKEILETIINTLVSNKEAVSINQIDGEQSVIFEVKVAENDMGKVIGKEGRIVLWKYGKIRSHSDEKNGRH